MAGTKFTISQRMGLGFTGVLLVAGVTFYVAKQNIAERRKAELDQYRACMSSFLSNSFSQTTCLLHFLLGVSLHLAPWPITIPAPNLSHLPRHHYADFALHWFGLWALWNPFLMAAAIFFVVEKSDISPWL
ncbi:hypothetical protein BDZ97DRAFT_812596 [Flammula alnicola]|nr:hypothetical protein BDZ97DRAFT_812596 [Flammula alnicola]